MKHHFSQGFNRPATDSGKLNPEMIYLYRRDAVKQKGQSVESLDALFRQ